MRALATGALLGDVQGGPVLAPVWRAASPWQRMRGLLGRPPLQAGQALLITPCSSVHTVGMRYPLDVVFLDADDRVVKLCRAVAPLRAAAAWGARHAVELAAGEIDRLGLLPGQRLTWRS